VSPQATGPAINSILGGDTLQHVDGIHLTPRILKSLYPKADLGAASEGFAMTCTEEEANELVRGFHKMTTLIIEMIPLNAM
jgi:hypothetical protein